MLINLCKSGKRRVILNHVFDVRENHAHFMKIIYVEKLKGVCMRSRESRRYKIMNAAIKIIAAKGYNDCRVKDISEAAGVGHGSLYTYYKNKEDVLFSIFRYAWSNLFRKIDRLNQTECTPVYKIIKISNYIFRSYQCSPDLLKMMIMDMPTLKRLHNSESDHMHNRLLQEVADIVAEGQNTGQLKREIMPTIASYAIVGIIENTVKQFVSNNINNTTINMPQEEIARHIVELFCNDSGNAIFYRQTLCS